MARRRSPRFRARAPGPQPRDGDLVVERGRGECHFGSRCCPRTGVGFAYGRKRRSARPRLPGILPCRGYRGACAAAGQAGAGAGFCQIAGEGHRPPRTAFPACARGRNMATSACRIDLAIRPRLVGSPRTGATMPLARCGRHSRRSGSGATGRAGTAALESRLPERRRCAAAAIAGPMTSTRSSAISPWRSADRGRRRSADFPDRDGVPDADRSSAALYLCRKPIFRVAPYRRGGGATARRSQRAGESC